MKLNSHAPRQLGWRSGKCTMHVHPAPAAAEDEKVHKLTKMVAVGMAEANGMPTFPISEDSCQFFFKHLGAMCAPSDKPQIC